MPSSRINPQTARLGPHTVTRVGFGAIPVAGPGVFGPRRHRQRLILQG
jgi:hypothetical protein